MATHVYILFSLIPLTLPKVYITICLIALSTTMAVETEAEAEVELNVYSSYLTDGHEIAVGELDSC